MVLVSALLTIRSGYAKYTGILEATRFFYFIR